MELGSSEEMYPARFAAPVGVDFIKAWRCYEEYYREVIRRAVSDEPSPYRTPRQKKSDVARRGMELWENSDATAGEWGDYIEWAFSYIGTLASDGRCEDEEVKHNIKEAQCWWVYLTCNIGVDIYGILRRRGLVPFILVPRHVSARYGDSAQSSLLVLLQEAQSAFIFGVSRSSIALMRATLERMLVDHYGASGMDLREKIDSIPDTMLSWRSKQDLHAIRKLANRVLHEGQSVYKDSSKHEIEIATHLETLRLLIENAPLHNI